MSTTTLGSKSEKIFVTSLQDKQVVTTSFLTKNKTILRDKKGKAYISLLLSDATGDIDAKIWDNVDSMERSFESGDIVTVKGVIQIYQNRKQLVVHKLERVEGETDIQDYIKKSNVSPELMLDELIKISESVVDLNIKKLILNTITDEEIRPLLLVSPAAKTVHHAKLGGLIEHIVSICKLANSVCQQYSMLNRDLVIFGAIFHDIGKIWELKINQGGIYYTNRGRLIGHLTMGVELIEKKASEIADFPDALKDICKHIVLSHHGKLEYGSAKRPKTLEAYVVWMLDDFDSKMDSIQAAMSVVGSDLDWSQHSTLFDRYFYLKGNQWDS